MASSSHAVSIRSLHAASSSVGGAADGTDPYPTRRRRKRRLPTLSTCPSARPAGTSCSPCPSDGPAERDPALVDQPPGLRAGDPKPRRSARAGAPSRRRRSRSAPPRSPPAPRAREHAVELLLGPPRVRRGVQPRHDLTRERALGVPGEQLRPVESSISPRAAAARSTPPSPRRGCSSSCRTSPRARR